MKKMQKAYIYKLKLKKFVFRPEAWYNQGRKRLSNFVEK